VKKNGISTPVLPMQTFQVSSRLNANVLFLQASLRKSQIILIMYNNKDPLRSTRVMVAKLARPKPKFRNFWICLQKSHSTLFSKYMLASYAIKLPCSENQIKCTFIFRYIFAD
jgi:hypothetical protein